MTAPCPQIATFMLMSGPSPHPWCARFVVEKADPKTGKPWLDFLPMIFDGAAEHEVMARARNWWAAEQRKRLEKIERGKHAAGVRAARAKGAMAA